MRPPGLHPIPALGPSQAPGPFRFSCVAPCPLLPTPAPLGAPAARAVRTRRSPRDPPACRFSLLLLRAHCPGGVQARGAPGLSVARPVRTEVAGPRRALREECGAGSRGWGCGAGSGGCGWVRGGVPRPRAGAGCTAQAPWAATSRDAAPSPRVWNGAKAFISLHICSPQPVPPPHLLPASCAGTPGSPVPRPRGPGSLSWAEGTPAPRGAARATHVGRQRSCGPRGHPPTRQPLCLLRRASSPSAPSSSLRCGAPPPAVQPPSPRTSGFGLSCHPPAHPVPRGPHTQFLCRAPGIPEPQDDVGSPRTMWGAPG